MVTVSIASLGVAALAAVVAIWQGVMARRQLRLAEETQGKTEQTLSEIRDVARDNKHLTEGLKAEIERSVTSLLEARVEHERNNNAASARFTEMMMQQMFMPGQADGRRGEGPN